MKKNSYLSLIQNILDKEAPQSKIIRYEIEVGKISTFAKVQAIDNSNTATTLSCLLGKDCYKILKIIRRNLEK
nr:MAG TPA: hypothetical protein [Caudoviricetes sp.]